MKQLSLHGRGLEAVPDDVFEHAATLEHLDLSGNRLTALPDRLVELKALKRLFVSNNPLEVLPPVLGQLPQLEMVGFKSCALRHVPEDALPARLRWLILTDNQLTELPDSLGHRPRLQKLALAGNRLRALPASFVKLARLELLRLSANDFPSLPDAVLSLPRLSWLAFAGNPFCARPAHATLELPWDVLELHEVLGHGASGVISRATRRDTGQQVAVKVFKGAVTSDGWPEDEVAAWLQAGHHPGLIGVEGRVVAHPAGAQALVLELLPPSLRPLGGPPDFESCTRDVMPGDWQPTDAQAWRVVRDVAAVVSHLHARGVVHGDLYAHNTRIDADGRAVVGDFGAASVMGGLAPEVRAALQRIELRAFAALVDDVVRCGATTLTDLRDACWSGAPLPDSLARG